MSAVRTIVAGIEHLSADDPILVASAALARGSSAALHLVHSYELPPLRDLAHHGAFARHDEEVRGRLAAAVSALAGGERADYHAVHGSAAHALLDTAGAVAADLLVVGAGGRHAVLGGTAQKVLRGASVPVLVVRKPVARTLERLLLATDLSELSAAAHERGLDIAAALFGGARAVRSTLVIGTGNLPAPLPEAALARAAGAELRRFLRTRKARGVRVEPSVRTGSPAEEIVSEAEAWGADLLVLGTHGRVLLGSVAEAVLGRAPCNVLAVPPCPEAPATADAERVAEAEGSWAATLAPAGTG